MVPAFVVVGLMSYLPLLSFGPSDIVSGSAYPLAPPFGLECLTKREARSFSGARTAIRMAVSDARLPSKAARSAHDLYSILNVFDTGDGADDLARFGRET